MNGEELQEAAREMVEELPASTLGHPFGPEHEVYKVKGKVFMLLTDVVGVPVVTLKAEPRTRRRCARPTTRSSPGTT